MHAGGGTVAVSAGRSVSVPAVGATAAAAACIDYDRLAQAVSGDRQLNHRDSRDAHLWALRAALRELPIARQATDPSMIHGAS